MPRSKKATPRGKSTRKSATKKNAVKPQPSQKITSAGKSRAEGIRLFGTRRLICWRGKEDFNKAYRYRTALR